MLRNILLISLAILVWLASTLAPAADGPQLIGEFLLPDLKLADIQNRVLPGTVANDRKINLGGFSDLFRTPADPPGQYWVVTDRGPNGTVSVDEQKRRTFPVPTYTPLVMRIRAAGDRLEIAETIPVVGRNGRAISGLPNLPGIDEPGFDFTGGQPMGYDPSGLDVEGLVRTPDGSFWLAEEYRPSLVKIDARGKVLKRIVPKSSKLDSTDYKIVEALPAVYARRQENRGFEGLAASRDGRMLYAALQSPLAHPTVKVGKHSRNTRILAFDTTADRPVAEFVYQFDVAEAFDPGAKPGDMKIGALSMIGPTRLLVLEQDDRVAKIYAVDLSKATNVLGAPTSGASAATPLEAIDDLPAAGIRPLPKKLIADLSKVDGLPAKLEGLCVVDRQTLALVNDNDFGFSSFDASGDAKPGGINTHLFLLRVEKLGD